jgi:hypothetical protein
MKTIYADFNDFDNRNSLPLICQGSTDCIRNLPEPLQEGEKVWLSDGELWVEAIVYKTKKGHWEAVGDWVFLDRKPTT